MNLRNYITLGVICGPLLCSCFSLAAVAPAFPSQAEAFSPAEIRLLNGPFKRAQELDARWLLSLEPDRLLAWFRKEAGLEPKAPNYGGWESQGIAGHSLGHYLSACSRMAQLTEDPRFKQRVDYIVTELAACQNANGNGYVAGLPNGKKVFAEVSRGEIRSAGFDLNGSWVPWYTLHKQLSGLIDAYELCGNDQALTVAARLADWAYLTTKDLTPEQWQKMLACEHGGMNEVLAQLYALTGSPHHLELTRQFYHSAVLDPLAAGRDELPGKHANTQIPKAIGAARIYQITGESKFAAIARNFYEIVLTNHTYVTGGNSDGEYFGPSGRLNSRLGLNTTETCNVYNMLKLARALFEVEPGAGFADYMERALYNQILASQHPENGRVLYYLTLKPGESKRFMEPHAFTCCSGTGMENHARYYEYIYSHSEKELYVNLFVASELNWKAKGLRLRQQTSFPESGRTILEFTASKPQHFTLSLRHPFWATNGYHVKLNGKKLKLSSWPGSYAKISRKWRTGDKLELEMPFALRTESMPDNPSRIALFYGPILLAGDLGPVSSKEPVPVLITESRPVADWLKPGKEVLSFHTRSVGRPTDVLLKPFYATYDHRHTVYWDVFTQADWRVREAEYEAERRRIRELESRTLDLFAIGEMQPERDHNVQGDKTDAAEFGGRKLRHAFNGGWFSFEIGVASNAPTDLLITYWGSETGNRTFDVVIENEKIATTRLHQDKPDHFWDKTYEIPESLTKGKQKVTVRFQAHPGNFAGGVFGVRSIERSKD